MKKVVPILLILFILLTSTCFAAYQPDPNRWTWINSTDTCGTFWDKTTAHYTNGGNTVEFWVCHVYPQKNTHVITNCRITKNPRTYTELQYTMYDNSTREIINSKTYSSYEQKAEYIHPCSWKEELYKAAFSVKYPEYKERMKVLWANDNNGVMLDTATIEYSSNGNIATYWIFYGDTKNIQESFWVYKQCNKSARTSAILYLYIFDGNSRTFSDPEYEKIIPESNGETIFKAVFPN